MATDMYTLGIAVDSTQVKDGTRELDKLAAAGEKAASTSLKISDAQREANRAMLGMGDSTKRAVDESRKLIAGQEELISALKREAETFGMSKTQMLQYEAAQRGVSEEAAKYINQIEDKIAAQNQAALAEKAHAIAVNAAMREIENFTARGEEMIRTLEKEVATFGMSRTELLRHEAAQRGVTAETDKYIDKIEQLEAAQREAAAAEKAATAAAMEAQRSMAMEVAQREELVNALKTEVETYGKSRTELLRYEAARRGAGAEAEKYIDQLEKLEQAEKEATKAVKDASDAARRTEQQRDQLIASLKQEAATYGMTTRELKEYQAAQLGLSSAIRPYLDDLDRKRLLETEAADATARAAERSEKIRGIFLGITPALVGMAAAYISVSAGVSAFMAQVDRLAALDDVAQVTGSTVENLSRLEKVAVSTGFEFGQVTGILGRFTKNLSETDDQGKEAIKAMQQLGIDTKNLAEQDPSEVFVKLSKKMAEFKDGPGKVAIAEAIMGRNARELLPYMNDVADSYDKVNADSTEAAIKATAFQDALNSLKVTVGELVNDIGQDLLPKLTEFAGALQDVFDEKKKLNDGTADDWIDESLIGLARLLDVMSTIPNLLRAVSAGFKSVFADIKLLVEGAKIVNPVSLGVKLWNGEDPLAKFNEQQEIANKLRLDAYAKGEKLWNESANKFEQALLRQRENRGRVDLVSEPPVDKPEIAYESKEAREAAKKAADEARKLAEERLKLEADMAKMRLDAQIKGYEDEYAAFERHQNSMDRLTQLRVGAGEVGMQGARDLNRESLEKSFNAEIDSLNKQLDAVKSYSVADVKAREERKNRIVDIEKQITEASEAFNQRRAEADEKYRIEVEKVESDSSDRQMAYIDGIEKQTKALYDSMRPIEETTVLLQNEEIARNNSAIAASEQQIAILQGQTGREGEIAQIQKTIDYLTQLNAAKQANVTAQVEKTEYDTADEALKRLNASLDPAKAKDFGQALSEAFGSAGNSITAMANALDNFGTMQAKIQKDREDFNAAKGNMSQAEQLETEIKLSKQSSQMQIAGMGQIAGAAKGMFNERSKGYKMLEAAERTFAAFQLAQSLVSNILLAKTAILTQGQGDPYSAFARMAAMAAAVAALGIAVGSVGGGGGSNIAADRQATTGTGTVLGDDSAKSESIANSIEMLAETSDITMKYSQGMLFALKSIEANIAGLARLVFQETGLRGGRGDTAGLGLTGEQSFGDKLFGPQYSLADQGLRINDQTIGDAINNFSADKYSTVRRKSKFLGITTGVSTNEVTGSASEELKDQFGMIIGGLVDSITSAGEALGYKGEEVRAYLEKFKITMGSLSFKDLSGEEVEKQLQAYFSGVGDVLAKYTIQGLESFQQVGEGYFETLMRVATGMEKARVSLDYLGVSMVSLKDINTDGDVATELIRESLKLQESAVTGWRDFTIQLGETVRVFELPIRELNGVGEILDTFEGSADELIELYTALDRIRRDLNKSNQDGGNLNRDMIIGAGGLDNLASGAEDYFKNFMTESQQAAANWKDLTIEFQRAGLPMVKTKDEFTRLLNSFDTTTESGAKMYGALIGLSGPFAEVIKQMEKLQMVAGQGSEAAEKAAQTQRKLIDNLTADMNRWISIRDRASTLRASVLDSMDDSRKQGTGALWEQLQSGSLSPEQQLQTAEKIARLTIDRYRLDKENAESMIEFGKSLRDYVKDLKTSSLTPLTNKEQLDAAASRYSDTLSRANSGDRDAQGDLSGVADTYLKEAREYYASSDAYTQIFNSVSGSIDKLGADQLDQGTRQLNAAEGSQKELMGIANVLGGIEAQAKKQIDLIVPRLDRELGVLVQMLDRLGRVDEMVDIMRALPAEIAARIGDPDMPQVDGTILPDSYYNGSYAVGTQSVPKTGLYELHRGEKILTAQQSSSGDQQLYRAVVSLQSEVATMRQEARQNAAMLAAANEKIAERNTDRIVQGSVEAASIAAWRMASKPGVK